MGIVAAKEGEARLDQSIDTHKEFTMRHFAAKLPPQHFNRIQPRAVGRQVQQYQPPGRSPHDGLDFGVLMHTGVVPGHIHGVVRMLGDEGF